MEHSLLDILWVVVAAGLVFVMQAGFAMVESGLTRSKNSINVAIKNLTDLGVSVLFFWLFGFALMFGISVAGLFGKSFFFFKSQNTWDAVFFMFQAMFCSTSATIVSGAVAERMKYSSYILSTILLSALIYPLFGHWVWGGALQGAATGWLGKLGFVDFAGSTVVHSLGGWVSLALLLILGPRTGRFTKDGKTHPINGSNIPMAVLGVIILWFGWFGFNGGSTLAMNGTVAPIILKTTLSAAAGMIGALALGWPFLKKPDINLVLNGALAGLVAITAPVHAVTELESIIIGAVGGGIMLGSTLLLEKLRIDDAVGAIPVHMAAGIWGTLCVALFGDPEILGTGLSFGRQLLVQLAGIGACGGLAFGLAFVVLSIINKIVPLRVSLEHEHEGLNKAEHGVTTEILDLYMVLEEQSRTGDLSLRAPVEPFTEVGQIAGMYNNVMTSLEENTIEKSDYLDILENVTDGMFLIDTKGIISPYYSSVLPRLFEVDKLEGRDIFTVLKNCFKEEVITTFREFFDILIDNSMNWRTVEKLNPLKDAEAWFDDEEGGFLTKNLTFFFKRVYKDDQLTRIMVIVRDITEQRRLAEEVARTRADSQVEMELFYKILHIEPTTLSEFLSGMSRDLERINGIFELSGEVLNRLLEEAFRLTHGIKGDADMLDLEFIVDKATEAENIISSLLLKKSISNEEILPLTLKYSELETTLGRIKKMVSRWVSFQDGYNNNMISSEELLGTTLTELTLRLGDRHKKNLRLKSHDLKLPDLDENKKKAVKDILIQLIRNSAVHGIEEPRMRLQLGKDDVGIIQISSSIKDNILHLTFKDDGAGIDSEKIRTKAVEKGILSEEKAKEASSAELIRLIFSDGFSTAQHVDKTAGRGVGMSLVNSIIREHNGKISVRSRKGQFCEINMRIPLS